VRRGRRKKNAKKLAEEAERKEKALQLFLKRLMDRYQKIRVQKTWKCPEPVRRGRWYCSKLHYFPLHIHG
jgi:hypothetical protein